MQKYMLLELEKEISQRYSCTPEIDILGLGTQIVKVPRPGDSEVTFSVFESSCHLLLP